MFDFGNLLVLKLYYCKICDTMNFNRSMSRWILFLIFERMM